MQHAHKGLQFELGGVGQMLARPTRFKKRFSPETGSFVANSSEAQHLIAVDSIHPRQNVLRWISAGGTAQSTAQT